MLFEFQAFKKSAVEIGPHVRHCSYSDSASLFLFLFAPVAMLSALFSTSHLPCAVRSANLCASFGMAAAPPVPHVPHPPLAANAAVGDAYNPNIATAEGKEQETVTMALAYLHIYARMSNRPGRSFPSKP